MSQLGYFKELADIKNKGGFANENDQAKFLAKIKEIEADDIETLLEQICQSIDVKRESPATQPPVSDIIKLEDLSRVDFNFGYIRKYERYAKEKLADGTTVKQRIDALKEAKRWLNDKNGAQRPKVTNLSKDQSKAIEDAFNNRSSKTIQLVTKGRSFISIAAFKRHVDSQF